jgi:hypothetical protein
VIRPLPTQAARGQPAKLHKKDRNEVLRRPRQGGVLQRKGFGHAELLYCKIVLPIRTPLQKNTRLSHLGKKDRISQQVHCDI